MLKLYLAPAAALSVFILANAPTQAAVVRAWVSGHGNDVAGCGAPTNACRTLQYAHDNIVSAGGEIDILDPAGYGTLTITKAISVVNDGAGTAGVQAASGVAITINAGVHDAVRLKGLNIEGLGTAINGIQFSTGASLTVEDCTVKDFTASQLSFQPTVLSTLYVSHSRFEHSGPSGRGIYIIPLSLAATATATLDHVEAVNNGGDGIGIDSSHAGGGAELQVTITDSVMASNGGSGLFGTMVRPGLSFIATIRRSTFSSNNVGITNVSGSTGTIYLGQSTFAGDVTSFSGAVLTFGDNLLGDNLTGTAPIPVTYR
jgi:hypothetical protein